MGKYKVVENNFLRGILSRLHKEYRYIGPEDVKSVLNHLRGTLERILRKVSREGCFPQYINAKYRLEEDIEELEKYEYKRIKRK